MVSRLLPRATVNSNIPLLSKADITSSRVPRPQATTLRPRAISLHTDSLPLRATGISSILHPSKEATTNTRRRLPITEAILLRTSMALRRRHSSTDILPPAVRLLEDITHPVSSPIHPRWAMVRRRSFNGTPNRMRRLSGLE